jgi:hypothetical protein
MTETFIPDEGLDPLAFNLACERLNETKEAIFASNWTEKQQELLADFAEAAADLLEMVKAAYLGRTPPSQISVDVLRDELNSAACLLETLSEDLPEDDVPGVMMKVMAQRNRAVLAATATEGLTDD